ncbi:MAG: SurA N-terminal domain-containing protein [Desulfobulbaceae bacterium]|nr:SurA N-terminal domain-containing protein [Desulfobulbaceae bacterium]
MLGLFRRKAQSPTLQFTILIIILVFIFWGVGRNDNNASINAVATVNGETISFRDYQKQYDQTITSMRDQFGGSLPSGLLEQLNVKQQVINKLVQSALLRQGAQKIGIYVSDQELQNAIKEMPAFQNNGFFDVNQYEQILAGNRMTVSQFEEGMRYDLLSAKVLDHLGRFGHVSPAALQDIFNYQYRGLKLDYVSFSPDAYKDKVEKTDALLSAFFEENKTKYQTAPQVKIKSLQFLFTDFAKDSAPDDEAVQKYYQANIDSYSLPERRKARHILIKTTATDSAEQKAAKRKKIDEIAAEIKAGKDFAELAKKHSEDTSAKQGGDLGLFGRGQMIKPFEDAVFAMKEGQTSDVVETTFGLHLIKLDKIEAAKTQSLDEVKAAIIAKLTLDASKNKAFQAANEAYEQIIVAGSLAKYSESQAANGNGAKIIESELFTQQNPPKDLQGSPELVKAAFTLNKGELSSIIEGGQGYAILLVDDKIPPTQQELSAVRGTVENDFVAAESIKLAKQAAEALHAKIKEGGNLAQEAKTLGLEVESTPFISRANNSEAKLPGQIIQDALSLSEQNPLLEKVASDNNTFYVVAYNASQEPDQTLFEAKKGELETKLSQERKNDLVTAWIETLRQKSKITTNEKIL